MKVLAFVLSTVFATLITVAGSVALVLAAPHSSSALPLTGILVLTAVVYGALLFGSLLTYFDPKRSQPSMKFFRRWALVIGAIDVIALVALFIVVGIDGASFWLPVSFTIAAIVLFAIAILVGNALRKYDERRDDQLPNWGPVTHQQIMRKVIKIVVTFVAAFVIVVVAEFVLSSGLGKSGRANVATMLTFGMIFAFFASGFACVLVTLPLNRQLRSSLNRDLGLTRKLARVVLRKKKDELTEDERQPAARYAATISITLSFTTAYIVLLYAGLAIQTVEQLARGDEDPIFGAFFALLLVVVLVAIFPLQIVRIRRARTYAREHADLLGSELPATPATL